MKKIKKTTSFNLACPVPTEHGPPSPHSPGMKFSVNVLTISETIYLANCSILDVRFASANGDYPSSPDFSSFYEKSSPLHSSLAVTAIQAPHECMLACQA